MVAEAFIPNPDNLLCVNHINENKVNNCINNLEWCTQHYNNIYGDKIEKLKKSVYQYTLDGILINKWDSAPDVAKFCLDIRTNSSTETKRKFINSCCNKVRESAYGYMWSFSLFIYLFISLITNIFFNIDIWVWT